jgi:hypothetical protein
MTNPKAQIQALGRPLAVVASNLRSSPGLRLAPGFLMLDVRVTSSGADATSYDGTYRTAD